MDDFKTRPTTCSKCGAEFDDYEGGVTIRERLGYGSKFDGAFVHIRLCCKCTDKLIDSCKEKVLSDEPPF